MSIHPGKQRTRRRPQGISDICTTWRQRALSAQPVARHKVIAVIEGLYHLIDKPVPKITFFDSPHAALIDTFDRFMKTLDWQVTNQLEHQIIHELEDESLNVFSTRLVESIVSPLQNQLRVHMGERLVWQMFDPLNRVINLPIRPALERQVLQKLGLNELYLDHRLEQIVGHQIQQLNTHLVSRLVYHLRRQVQTEEANRRLRYLQGVIELQPYSQFVNQLGHRFASPLFHMNGLYPMLQATQARWIDICTTFLQRGYNPLAWDILKALVTDCGWIFPYEKECLVCDRPIKLALDDQSFLHAEGTVSMLFSDGSSLYAHHGILLPKEYGQVPPQQWQTQWLWEESNPQLRELLIQTIGYERICQDLQDKTVEIDTWQDYALVRVDRYTDDIFAEPMLFLKMMGLDRRPSQFIRVPRHIQSAKEAVRWINWGIHPEGLFAQS